MPIWQIVIADSSNLSGESVSELLTAIGAKQQCQSVQLLHFEGASNVPVLEQFGNRVLEYSWVAEALRSAVQVDWATFVFHSSDHPIPAGDDVTVADLLLTGATIVRCVDGAFFYVYTADESLARALNAWRGLLTIDNVDVDNIEWPE